MELADAVNCRLSGGDYNNSLALAQTIDYGDLSNPGYIAGADIFIRSSVFRQIGGFDPNFFMFFVRSILVTIKPMMKAGTMNSSNRISGFANLNSISLPPFYGMWRNSVLRSTISRMNKISAAIAQGRYSSLFLQYSVTCIFVFSNWSISA